MARVEKVTEPRDFDITVAHPARIWNYWLGGKDNFAADRTAAEQVLLTVPTMAEVARAGRQFLADVVQYLTAEAGVRQFIDVGTGLPTANNTHEVAQRIAPSARIVYVDNDPIVLAHSRALLKSSREGICAYIDADARDTDKILAEAAQALDLTRPVAVVMLAILHFIPDADDPRAIIGRLLAGVPSGSYLAISHAANDIAGDAVAAGTRSYNEHSAAAVTPRSLPAVTGFLDRLEIVPPGVVPLGHWAPGARAPGAAGSAADGPVLPTYSALARKP